MSPNDWIREAAEDIAIDSENTQPFSISVELIDNAIRRRVPRCDQCKHWIATGGDDLTVGYCLKARMPDSRFWPEMYDGILTVADFGCVELGNEQDYAMSDEIDSRAARLLKIQQRVEQLSPAAIAANRHGWISPYDLAEDIIWLLAELKVAKELPRDEIDQ